MAVNGIPTPTSAYHPHHVVPWPSLPVLNTSSAGPLTPTAADATDTSTSHTLMTIFPAAFKTACFVLAGVIALLNGAVIAAYVVSVRVRGTMSVFLLNLALVDFQNGCVSLPLLLLFPRTELEVSPGGSVVACVILLIWPKILFIVAFQSVLVVTIERFICVTKPYTHAKLLRTQRCICAIIALWIFALCFSLVPLLGYDRITSKGSVYMCDGAYQQGVVYIHVLLYGLLATPVALIMVLYLLMYRIARAHSQSIRKLHAAGRSEDGRRQRQIVQTSKAAKTVGLLSSFYLVCWLPFLVLLQVSEMCKLGECPPSLSRESLQKAAPVTILLAFLGCAINPIIYIFRTRTIRNACWTTLARWGLCERDSLRFASTAALAPTSVYTDAYFSKNDRGYSMSSLNSALASHDHATQYTIVPS